MATAIAASELHEDVRKAIDPQERGRQFVASQLEKHTGTRMAGYMLTRQVPASNWGRATYALARSSEAEPHGGHRGHGTESDQR